MNPAVPASFDQTTAVREIEPGMFEATIDREWWVMRGPHGGYVAAVMLRALEAAVADPSRPPRSFTTHYLAPPAEGPMRIRTSVERAGRQMTFASARAEQGGRPVVLSLGTFAPRRASVADHDAAPMPAVLPPEQGGPAGRAIGGPPFTGNFEYSHVIGARFGAGAPEAVVGGWTRLADGHVADAAAVAAMCDAWWPPLASATTTPILVPTVDLTVHFRAALPLPGARPEDWYLCRFRTSLAREGFFEEDGEVWAPGGTLVGQSRQLGVILPFPG